MKQKRFHGSSRSNGNGKADSSLAGWVLLHHQDAGRPQLWFAALDLRRLAAGGGQGDCAIGQTCEAGRCKVIVE